MKKDELPELLNELTQLTTEQVDPTLAEAIKNRIPWSLLRQRGGIHTISIIIDLRVGKLAAAAVIILAMILCAHFFSSRDWKSDGIFQNGKMIAKYLLSGKYPAAESTPVARSRYYYLREQGKEAVYYGDVIDPKDPNAILIHWKLRKGRYKVLFADLTTKTVTAEQLISLQARMLQNKAE